MTFVIPIAVAAICLICLVVVAATTKPATATAADGNGQIGSSMGSSPFAAGVVTTMPASMPSNRISLPHEFGDGHVDKLKMRLVQAGLYKRNAKSVFNFLQFSMVAMALGIAFICFTTGMLAVRESALVAGIGVIMGIVGPGLWLDRRKSRRQSRLRRGLPDALDVITVCVEAGLSLDAALVRVSNELETAHPMLAEEMTIVQREIQMGKSTGQALKSMSIRFDVEELRSLASVVEQSRKFGAKITEALQVYAESLRERRMQMAQIRAQKAAVKLLFPTVLCIFPSLLVVILGPAAFEIYATFYTRGL